MNKRIIYNGFDIALGVIFVSFNFYVIYWIVILPPTTISTIGYIFLLIWGFYSSLHLRTALIRRHHLQLSNRIKVSQKDCKSFLVYTANEKVLVTIDKLKFIDLFYSWNTNPFSSDLQYARLELTNGKKILIPEHSIEIHKLEIAFKNKVRIVKSRFMNRLR